MNPTISVIIPIYNREKYLNKCVDSVLLQTFVDFELILVDDGSTDGSADICDEYYEKDARVRVIHKKNGGASSARNEGVRLAEGEYVTFVDSDDYVDSTFLQYAYDAIKETNCELIATRIVTEQWHLDEIVHSFSSNASDEICDTKKLIEDWALKAADCYMISSCAKLYKLDVIKKHKICFDNSVTISEDVNFNLDYISHIKKVVLSPEMLYHYRKSNQSSLTSTFHENYYEIHRNIYNKRRDLMRRLGCSQKAMIALEIRWFDYQREAIMHYWRSSQKTSKKEKISLLEKISNDEHIKSLKLGDVNSLQKKIMLILLRLKCHRLTWLLFDIYFKIRLRSKET